MLKCLKKVWIRNVLAWVKIGNASAVIQTSTNIGKVSYTVIIKFYHLWSQYSFQSWYVQKFISKIKNILKLNINIASNCKKSKMLKMIKYQWKR